MTYKVTWEDGTVRTYENITSVKRLLNFLVDMDVEHIIKIEKI